MKNLIALPGRGRLTFRWLLNTPLAAPRHSHSTPWLRHLRRRRPRPLLGARRWSEGCTGRTASFARVKRSGFGLGIPNWVDVRADRRDATIMTSNDAGSSSPTFDLNLPPRRAARGRSPR